MTGDLLVVYARSSEEQPRYECDCCVEGVTIVCKVYFGVYLLLAALTVATLINYRKVRTRSRVPTSIAKDTSKYWIVVGVALLQVFRIIYFSTAFFYESFET